MTDSTAPAAVDPSALATLDGADFAEHLAAVDDAARADTDADKPANTTRAYSGDWSAWEAFCDGYGLPVSAGSVGTLTAFVKDLAGQGYAPSTVERRVYGVTVTLAREHGVELSRDDRQSLRQALTNLKRHQAHAGQRRGRGKAKAVTVKQLRAMSKHLPTTLAGVRDRALLLIGFGMAARRSELAALRVGDLRECAEGLCVWVAWSKTGAVEDDTRIPWGTSAATCPVTAWRTYRQALETTLGRALDDDEPAFRQVDRHGRILAGLSGESVGTAIKRAADRAGIEGITGHSLRAGLATESRKAGHDAKTVTDQGRWSNKSTAVYDYFRTVDGWEDNAVTGIGL